MDADRKIAVIKWDFIGMSIDGKIRRYCLSFSVQTRKYSSAALTVTQWEADHSSDLVAFYRPVAVLRSMLPKGNLATAMKAMLKQEQIAEATAISIFGGKTSGHNS